MMNKNYHKGFTLVEMMVVILIFSIIVGAMAGLFVSVIQVQRNTLAAQLLLDQTSYAMEYASRSLRMAKKDTEATCLNVQNDNYQYGLDINNDSNIWFLNHEGVCQSFKRDDTSFEDCKENRIPSCLDLFSSNFKVKTFSVSLMGENGFDNIQPRVTISLDIKREGLKFEPEIKIQTTVSQRDLDI